MDKDLIARYQPGGDLFAAYKKQFGYGHAVNIGLAAKSGDKFKVNDAINAAKWGPPLDDSIISNLFKQLATDPFGAPFDWLQALFGKTIAAFIRNYFVLIAALLIVAGLVIYFGGWRAIKNRRK